MDVYNADQSNYFFNYLLSYFILFLKPFHLLSSSNNIILTLPRSSTDQDSFAFM